MQHPLAAINHHHVLLSWLFALRNRAKGGVRYACSCGIAVALLLYCGACKQACLCSKQRLLSCHTRRPTATKQQQHSKLRQREQASWELGQKKGATETERRSRVRTQDRPLKKRCVQKSASVWGWRGTSIKTGCDKHRVGRGRESRKATAVHATPRYSCWGISAASMSG